MKLIFISIISAVMLPNLGQTRKALFCFCFVDFVDQFRVTSWIRV